MLLSVMFMYLSDILCYGGKEESRTTGRSGLIN